MPQGASETITTSGTNLNSWYGRRKAGEILEKVSITDEAAYMTLNNKIPPRSRIVAAQIRNVTAFAVQGTSAANGTADGAALVLNGPTSGSANSAAVIMFTDNTSSSTLSFGTAGGTSALLNDTTTEYTVGLYPADVGGGGTNTAYLDVGTNTASDFNFNGTATVYVWVAYETYKDLPTS